MNWRLLSAVFILSTIGWVFGQSAGTTSFEFLRNQYSPRGAAMGGNLMAVKNDIQAALYNPASLSGNTEKLWSINYNDHLLDFQGGYLAYAQPFSTLGNVSANLIYFNYGSFDETDIFGDATGQTFTASEFAIALGLSNTLGSGFDYGIGMKYFYSAIYDYNASGIAMDAGLMYTAPGVDNLQFGVSLLNLGVPIDDYTTRKEKLPVYLQLGFSKQLEHLPLLFTGSFIDVAGSDEEWLDRLKKFAIGGEFDVTDMIKFRLGYQNDVNRSVKPLGRNVISGFSVGLGILWNQFRLDYAYSNYGDLGSQNRIGVSGSL
jgi:hypothetical protein